MTLSSADWWSRPQAERADVRQLGAGTSTRSNQRGVRFRLRFFLQVLVRGIFAQMLGQIGMRERR